MRSRVKIAIALTMTISTLVLVFQNCQKVSVEMDMSSVSALMTASGGIVINNNEPFTSSKNVNLTLIQNSGDEMYISDVSGCQSGGEWEAYSPNKPWLLKDSNSEGKVFVKYREKAVPAAESDCFEDSIIHDDMPPTLQFSRTVPAYINTSGASVDLAAEDTGSGVERIECSSSLDSKQTACSERFFLDNLKEGAHFITALAVDRVGNRSLPINTHFLVDLTAPSVTFNQTPPKITNSSVSEFRFSANDALSGIDRIECRLDTQSDFATCTSPFSITVTPGNRTLYVRAVDLAGNISEPSNYSYLVDLSAPSVRITQMPSPFTNIAAAAFSFDGTDDGVPLTEFECALDTSGFAACTSPQSFSALSVGNHTFQVRGIDAAGNRSSPATYTWIIDTTAPVVQITKNPAAIGNQTSPTISFTATDANSGINKTECQIDGGAYQACNSPFTLSNLAEGSHSVNIRATDRAGNTSSPVASNFVIDTTKPIVQILSGPTNPTNVKDAVLTFTASDPGSNDPTRIASQECQLDGGAWLSCQSPATFANLADGNHSVNIRATDVAGNVSDVKSHVWLLDSKGPSINFSKQPLSVIGTFEKAEIIFAVTDSGVGLSTVLCGMDGQLQPCVASDSKQFTNLPVGDYVFVVQATDKLGNASENKVLFRVEILNVPYSQEVIVTESNKKVDILVVIDNSGSMKSEQQNMAARFGTFLDQLKNLDWQVAIITTDVSSDMDKKDGRFLKFTGLTDTYILNSQMDLTTAKSAFAATIQRPASEGSPYEQGIRATYRAIERSQNNTLAVNAPNRAFFRSDAAFAALVVTDANETSSGGTLPSNLPENLANLVATTWSNQKAFAYHSIIVKPGDSACLALSENEGYGYAYETLSKLTGGVIGSVCATDYSGQLTSMGQGVVNLVKSTTLQCAPLDMNWDGKPDVKITTADGSPAPTYTVLGTRVTFSTALPVGTNRLDYDCLKPAK